MIWRILLGAIGGFFFEVGAWAVLNSGVDSRFNMSDRWFLHESNDTLHTLMMASLGALAGYCWHMLTVDDKEDE